MTPLRVETRCAADPACGFLTLARPGVRWLCPAHRFDHPEWEEQWPTPNGPGRLRSPSGGRGIPAQARPVNGPPRRPQRLPDLTGVDLLAELMAEPAAPPSDRHRRRKQGRP